MVITNNVAGRNCVGWDNSNDLQSRWNSNILAESALLTFTSIS